MISGRVGGVRFDPPPSRASAGWTFLRDILLIFLIALLASILIKTFVVRSFYIPSASMESTLVKDDRVLVNELQPAVIPIERGDVVVFTDPGGWLPAQQPEPLSPVPAVVSWLLDLTGLSATDSNDHLIKRVIGVGGDRVVCCNPLGQTSVNNVPLDEPYVRDPLDGAAQIAFSVTVPEGSLWVEGDNRGNSRDSRFNRDSIGGGFIPLRNVVGRAVLVTFPVERWTILDDYPRAFAGIP